MLTCTSAYTRICKSLSSPGALSSRLAAISARKQLQRLSVGLRINGQRLFASTDKGIQLDSSEAEERLLQAACLAKPITATLLARAALNHDIDLSSKIVDVLAVSGPWKDRLTGITLNHLLNHTHGLDASKVNVVPRTQDGFLDTESLCTQLASKSLSPPGRAYSYGNAGAWLAAALLEQLLGQPYAHLLEEGHLWPSSSVSGPLHLHSICPATGEELELTLSQWLAFLELHLQDPHKETHNGRARALASLREAPVALPGWSPSEQGACLGWKFYGDGWFGHNSNLAGSSALLRFNPEHDIAVVVEASDDAAFIVLAGLFGTALPEFGNLRLPQLLNQQASTALELERYVGTYVQARRRLNVGIASHGLLRLVVEEQNSGAEVPTLSLRPAEKHIFLPEPASLPEFAFVQFVAVDHAGIFGYAWNGKQLWRREV